MRILVVFLVLAFCAGCGGHGTEGRGPDGSGQIVPLK